MVVGDGMTFAALFVTSMVLARTIDKTDMATYRQVTYLGPMVVAFVELGISSAVYRFLRYFTGYRQKAFLWNVLLAKTLLGGLGTLVLLVLASPLARAYGNEALALALVIAAAYPLAVMPFMLVRPLLICQGHSLKATSLETFFALVTSLAMIVPLWAGWTLDQALGLWITANLCRLPVAAWFLARELRGSKPCWDREIASEVWGYLWPLQLSRLPGIAMTYFDKVVTSLFLPMDRFAAYSLGAREIPFLNRIPFSISSVLVPRMVEAFQAARPDRVCELWRRACLSTAVVTFPFAAFAMWYAKPIVRVLFTARYDESAIPFGVFAGMTFLRVVDYGSMAKALGTSRVILRGSVIAAVTSLPLSLGLTYLWGIWGISFSLMLSCAILAAYYLVSYRAILQRPIHSFFPIWPLVGLAALSFLTVGLADQLLGRHLAIRDQVQTIPLVLRLVAVAVVSGASYLGSLLVLRGLAPAAVAGLRFPRSKN